MQQLDFVVPYEDRCVLTPSGSAVVWPFMNASKGQGPYELFLDTNALTKTRWAVELPRDIAERSILNPGRPCRSNGCPIQNFGQIRSTELTR